MKEIKFCPRHLMLLRHQLIREEAFVLIFVLYFIYYLNNLIEEELDIMPSKGNQLTSHLS